MKPIIINETIDMSCPVKEGVDAKIISDMKATLIRADQVKKLKEILMKLESNLDDTESMSKEKKMYSEVEINELKEESKMLKKKISYYSKELEKLQ